MRYSSFDKYLKYELGIKDKDLILKIVKFCYAVNNKFMTGLLKHRSVLLPSNMGELRLFEHKRRIKKFRGKYYTNQTENFYLTKKLWEENNEAKEQNYKVMNDGVWYDIVWDKPKRKNFEYYTFVPNYRIRYALGKENAESQS